MELRFFRNSTWNRDLHLIIRFVGRESGLAVHLLRGECTLPDLVHRLVADDSGFPGGTVETDQSEREGLHHDIFRSQQAGCSQEGIGESYLLTSPPNSPFSARFLPLVIFVYRNYRFRGAKCYVPNRSWRS